MRKLFLTGAMALAIAASAGQAQAATVATFADPTVGMPGQPPPFLFTYTAAAGIGTSGGTLSGGYTGTNLTLNLLGTAYAGATFEFPTLVADGTFTADGFNLFPSTPVGTITFFDAAHTEILLVDFTSASLTNGNVANQDELVLNVVNIKPPSGPDFYLDPESFAFSFANQTRTIAQAEAAAEIGTIGTTVQTTASFTSSATVVPEPGTMTLFGSGLVGLASALRRRYGKKQA